MVKMIINVLYIFILSLNISIISDTISIKKMKIKNILIMTILIYTPSYLLYIFNKDIFLVPVSIIIVFLWYFVSLKSIQSAIFISIFTQLIFALSDAVTGIIFVFILKFSYSQIESNKILYLTLSLIIFVISFIISKIMYKFIKSQYVNNINIKNKKDIFVSLLCIIMVLLLIYSYTIIFKSLSRNPNKIIIILNFFLIISFITLLIIIAYSNSKNIKKELEEKRIETELKQLTEYIDMVEQVSSDLRSFKHDYLNIIKIIGGYLDLKSYNELSEFYKRELMPESIKILEKDRCFLLLNHIKITPLKGLISSKIIIAQSKKINTKLSINDDIDNLSISVLDICRILGVILDNAIEAAESCDNRFIEIVIFNNDKITTFIINNSCPINTPPIYKIYEENFSTKGIGRGIGLKSVRNIINEKYKNVSLNTKVENSVFQQELVIF